MRTPADNFCCLGVLCDVSGQGEWRQDEEDGGNWEYVVKAGEEESPSDAVGISALPHLLFKLYGFNVKQEVEDNSPDTEGLLITLNDSRGYTFAQIADWVEANL